MNTSIHNTVQYTLNGIPAIKLAILFGSVAGNREIANSDIDLIDLRDASQSATARRNHHLWKASASRATMLSTPSSSPKARLIGQIFYPIEYRILEEKHHTWIGK